MDVDYERVAVSTTFKHHLLSDSPDKRGKIILHSAAPNVDSIQ